VNVSRRGLEEGAAEVITRRKVAWIAIFAIALLAIVGCGGGASSSSNDQPSSKLTIDTPPGNQSVEKVVWALPNGEPNLIDPARGGDYSPDTVEANLCESLLQVQPDYSLKPNLAEKWDQVNPTTLVFTIRPGVKFWDGKPLTAEDVAYSLRRNTEPSVQPVYSGAYESVKSVTATGPLQVTVKFTKPDAAFLPAIASMAGAISEKAFVEKAGKEYGTAADGVMCTGPYKFGSWASGDHLTITRNEDYWNPELTPKVKEVEFKFISNNSTLSNALLSGEVEGTYEVPTTSLSALANSSVGKVYLGPSTEWLVLGPVSSTGPGADPRIRQALSLSIDKSLFIKNALEGAGEPLKTFTTPFLWSGNPAKAIYQKGYDALPDESPNIQKAKQLVKEADPSTRTLTVATTAGNQLEEQLATLVQGSAKELGLTVKIKVMQPAEVYELFFNAERRKEVDFLATTGFYEAPTPLYMANGFIYKGGIVNWIGYNNPTATKELEAAYASLDPKKSAEHFVKAQSVWYKSTVVCAFAVAYERLFMNSKISGAPASIGYLTYPWAARLGGTG